MSNILEINQDQFIEQVIEKSKTVPVLVDFWAPWCGPCKQLTPLLENLVNKKNGKIILIKINVDENQGIAAQLNIQSIPTVYGFVNGRPVDAFQGAQPESKIEIMINKLIDATPGNEVPKLLEEADGLFKEKKFEEAYAIFENLITLDPGNAKIIAGLLRCLVQLKKSDEASDFLNSLDDAVLQDDEIIKIKKLLSQTSQADGVNIDEIQLKVQKDPSNLDLRYELAEALLNSNNAESGFNELLEIFKTKPQWNDGAAKKKLLEHFDLLGINDPIVIEARKRLSSLLFK